MHKIRLLKFTIVLFSILLTNYCFAKQNQSDSVLINKLIDKAYELQGNNNDSANYYAKKGLQLAIKKQEKALVAKAYFNLGMIHLAMKQFDSSRYYLNNCIPYFKLQNNYQDLLESYYYIRIGFSFEKKQDSIYYYQRQELRDAKRSKDVFFIQRIYTEMIGSFIDFNKMDSALHYLAIMQREAEHTKTETDNIDVFENYAKAYAKLKDYKKTMYYIDKNIALLKLVKDTSFTKNKEVFTRKLAYAYDEACKILSEANEHKKALNFSQKALSMYKNEVKDAYAHCNSIYQNALVNYKLQDFDTAFTSATLSLQMAEKMHKQADVSELLIQSLGLRGLIKSKLRIGDLSDCEAAAKYAGKEAKNNPEICECFYLQNRLLGNTNEALHYYEKLVTLKDSINNTENYQKVVQLELQFEYEKKKSLLDKEKTITILYASKQRQQRNWLILGAGLLLAALGAGGIAYRKSRKYSQFLAEEEKRKELLLQEVHHRTNNSLQLISALLTMQSEQIEDPKAKGYIQQSESRIHSMSALHELLHSNSTEIEVNMADYLWNIIDFHRGLAVGGIEITANLLSQPFQAKVAMPIALITNELITNSLKYAFDENQKNKVIHIVLGETDKAGEWILTVSDNGKGLPSNAFKEGEGSVGTKLITILTRQLGGKLITENNNGAVVNIFFDPNRKK